MPRQFCVCNSHKSCTLAHRKFAVGHGINREKTGNLKMQFEWVPCTLQIRPSLVYGILNACFYEKNIP